MKGDTDIMIVPVRLIAIAARVVRAIADGGNRRRRVRVRQRGRSTGAVRRDHCAKKTTYKLGSS